MSADLKDVAQIAAKLTKAQREAISHSAPRGFGYPANFLFHAGRSATGSALFRRGVVGMTGRLTPLGLAVKARLEANP